MSAQFPMQIETREDGTHFIALNGFVLQTAFQPIFRFSAGRLAPIACEALLRVTRSGTPALTEAFLAALPRADAARLEPMLRWMHIRNAGLIPAGMRRLFLNFDPARLGEPSLLEVRLRDLGAELRDAGMSPADIVCEITEGEAPDMASLRHFAWELRARGYRVAVDDFGARAARMDRVKAMAPDIVKLDGRLARRLMDTGAGFGTLKLMTGRFRADGIDTVLEGVESLWQLELAERAGAAMVQGFVTAAPRIADPGLGDWLSQYLPGNTAGGGTAAQTG